ncbi:MAG: hypothetical protein JW801_08140 [Bacteroidales bacterium]|nr:hypothetical protein [Bacteroidales bacterium]
MNSSFRGFPVSDLEQDELLTASGGIFDGIVLIHLAELALAEQQKSALFRQATQAISYW